MSKLRALELACGLFNPGAVTGSDVLSMAAAFAEFLGEGSQTIGNVVGKPRKPTAAPSAPLAAETAATAANAATVAEVKTETKAPETKTETKTEVKTEVKAAATTVTAEEIKALIGKVASDANVGGAPKAREILNKNGGAVNLTTLKPEFYASVKAEIDALYSAAALVA